LEVIPEIRCSGGATENARPENAERSKMQDWKMRCQVATIVSEPRSWYEVILKDFLTVFN